MEKTNTPKPKLGKFIHLKHKDYKIEIATMNHFDCKSCYINFGFWAKPEDYLTESIRLYSQHLRFIMTRLKEQYFEYNECNILRNIDYSEFNKGGHKNRTINNYTYVGVEITFLFKEHKNFEDVLFNSKLKDIGYFLVDDLFTIDHMSIQTTKKGL